MRPDNVYPPASNVPDVYVAEMVTKIQLGIEKCVAKNGTRCAHHNWNADAPAQVAEVKQVKLDPLYNVACKGTSGRKKGIIIHYSPLRFSTSQEGK